LWSTGPRPIIALDPSPYLRWSREDVVWRDECEALAARG
jgi:hypothetical protein